MRKVRYLCKITDAIKNVDNCASNSASFLVLFILSLLFFLIIKVLEDFLCNHSVALVVAIVGEK